MYQFDATGVPVDCHWYITGIPVLFTGIPVYFAGSLKHQWYSFGICKNFIEMYQFDATGVPVDCHWYITGIPVIFTGISVYFAGTPVVFLWNMEEFH